MDNLSSIITLASIVTVIGSIVKLYKIVKPLLEFKADIDKMKNDVQAIKKKVYTMEESNKLQCLYMINMANHMISGNGKDTIKQTRDEMLKHLSDM